MPYSHARCALPTPPSSAAHRLYKIALQRGFTRGRRTNQVRHASRLVCRMYVAARHCLPYMLAWPVA